MIELPQQLIAALQHVNGFDKDAFIAAHTADKIVTSIRINPNKILLTDLVANTSKVPWCDAGRYLDKRPSFTLDPTFHGGAYYVQEASSMFLDFILKQLYTGEDNPKHVLDLCAAPGGKSTLLAAALPNSFIVSNEVIKTRVTVLAENIAKWGSSNVVVTHNDPKDFKRLPAFFNLVVVDAPCSGSGLFRKDSDAINEWSGTNVELCSMRQRRIVADVITTLQQNGYLVYSTCSYSKKENEDICDWIIDEFKLTSFKINTDASWGIVETTSSKHEAFGYRFYPDKVNGEGFFIACFQQTNFVDEVYLHQSSSTTISKNEKAIVHRWINAADDYNFSKQHDLIIAFPLAHHTSLATVARAVSLRKSGVAIGTIKGKDFIPHHELALSGIISNHVPYVELDKDAAMQYLKRQAFAVPQSFIGWTLARFNNINLGWMKVLPNRVNNYYPVNWRILKP